MTLSFGDYEIDVERRELRRAKTPVHVESRVFDLLVYLVQNRDRVVSKDDLIASVWGEHYCGPAASPCGPNPRSAAR